MPCAVGEGRLTAEPERSGGWPEVSHFIFVTIFQLRVRRSRVMGVPVAVRLCVCAMPRMGPAPPPTRTRAPAIPDTGRPRARAAAPAAPRARACVRGPGATVPAAGAPGRRFLDRLRATVRC